jgi:hypothetical protein
VRIYIISFVTFAVLAYIVYIICSSIAILHMCVTFAKWDVHCFIHSSNTTKSMGGSKNDLFKAASLTK